jgi:hypothetical protein
MVQVVSRRPLTAEAGVRAQVSPFGICGGHSGIRTGLSPSLWVYPVSDIPPCSSIVVYHLDDEQ